MKAFPKNIQLSEKEELRAEIKNWRGQLVVDLRVWTAAKADESKWPTGKGFLIPVSRWPEVKRMMSDFESEAPVIHE